MRCLIMDDEGKVFEVTSGDCEDCETASLGICRDYCESLEDDALCSQLGDCLEVEVCFKGVL